MNYRKMVVALLFSIVMYAHEHEIDLHIKDLEVMKYNAEYKAAKFASRLHKEKKRFVHYAGWMAKLYVGPVDEKNKKALIPEEFEICISRLSCLFDAGEDIKPFVEKLFHSKDSSSDIQLMCVRLIIQKLVVDRMTDRYRDLTEKLRIINKELMALKQSGIPASGDSSSKTAEQ